MNDDEFATSIFNKTVEQLRNKKGWTDKYSKVFSDILNKGDLSNSNKIVEEVEKEVISLD